MQELRAEFPVVERLTYLNAGTNGPVPRRAVAAAEVELRLQAEGGRGDAAFFLERMIAPAERLRERVAARLGCQPGELALTGSTTDGVNAVVSALALGPGDEVLTSDEEHPGLLAPLATGRARRGFDVRAVPFEELAGEVGPRTRLVACSHVSWMSGRVVDAAALAAAGTPLLLDGAQGLGAVPVDVRELACDFYAASGQKWLCGPNGLGYLYVRDERIAELLPPWPGYESLVAPDRAQELAVAENASVLTAGLQAEARRFDMGLVPPHQAAWALAALDVLEAPGIQAVLERAGSLAVRLGERLAERGLRVASAGGSTLVSWETEEPDLEVERLRVERVVVRSIPRRPYVRASVGAWNDEGEVERAAALAA